MLLRIEKSFSHFNTVFSDKKQEIMKKLKSWKKHRNWQFILSSKQFSSIVEDSLKREFYSSDSTDSNDESSSDKYDSRLFV